MLNRMLPQTVRKFFRASAGCILLVCAANPVQASLVNIQVSDRIISSAEYRAGNKNLPAMLLLHGFLQTRDFGIVKSMGDELADSGYAVLRPTLSLGITHRKASLDCDALQLHDMAGDLNEIQAWVNWLRRQGYKRIVLIGHSVGGAQLLAWAEHRPRPNLSIIAVSLVGTRPDHPTAPPKHSKPAGSGLLQAPLSFCDNYTAPTKSFASYLIWDEKRVLAAVKAAMVPVDVILGSKDMHLPANWRGQLEQAGARVHWIEGADHFMGGTAEFDLMDILQDILKRQAGD